MLTPKHTNIIINGPIKSFDEAIPLGNGMFGALIWSELSKLRFSLDIAGLWLREQAEHFYAKDFTYAKLVALAKEGNTDLIRRIFDSTYSQPSPTKIPAGRLILTGLLAQNYTAELDLSKALATFSITKTKQEIFKTFICQEQKVGIIHLAAEFQHVNFKLERPCFGKITSSNECKMQDSVCPGSLSKLRLKEAVYLQTENLSGFAQELDREHAYTILALKEKNDIYYTVMTAKTVEAAIKAAKQELIDASTIGYAKLLSRHISIWHRYWQQSAIRVGDQDLEKLWYRANYYLKAASKANYAPMPLQGVWCADNDELPPWKGDYHNDLNTQFTYCHYLMANHLEEGRVWLDFLWSLNKQAHQFAKEFYNAEGLCLPSVMDIEGRALGGWPMYSLSPTNQIWLCQMFYEYYRISGDCDFLQHKVAPYFKETAQVIETLLIEDENSNLHLPVSSSPEIHDDTAKAWLTPNSNYDLTLLRYLYQTLMTIADKLHEDKSHYQSLLSKLAPLSIDEEKGLMLASNENLLVSHRHFSHALAIAPLEMLTYDKADERLIINKTIDHLLNLGSGQWVGFSFAWMALLQIARHNGTAALYELKRFSHYFLSVNGFHLNGDYKKAGLSSFHYRPFTLEANFLAAQAVQKMLLNALNGAIELLPAWPNELEGKNLAFQNLRAENGLLVGYKQKNGQHMLKLQATKTGEWYIKNIKQVVKLKEGQKWTYIW